MVSLIDTGPPPPCPAPFNLAEYVLKAGLRVPDRIALAVVGPSRAERWSHARLRGAVLGLAGALAARGLEPGDRVLIRLGNELAFPITFLAALAADLVPVPTSAQLTGREVEALAAQVRPRLVVAGPGIAVPAGVPVLASADLPALYDHAPAGFVMGDPERPGYVVFTSGTSGTPRAVVHAHRAIWARRMMWQGWYGLTGADRLMHAGAFNWTYTLGTGLLDPWSVGATALIPAEGVAPAQLPLLMRRHDATILAAAPGVYRRLLRETMPPMPRLRHGLSAGEKLADSLRNRWREATGTDLHEAFGMSECSTFISGAPDRPAPPGTVGYPQPGRRVAVLAEDGRPAAFGAVGELAVSTRDPGLMLGDARALEGKRGAAAGVGGEGADGGDGDDGEGAWFRTGDMARMAEDGAVTCLGRADDMMNAGGHRVSPAEVEAVFAEHPGLAECAAYEHRLNPETSVIALAYVAAGAVDQAELSAFASERLARYKQPRIYLRVDALPRGGNGKILRRRLRQSPTETENGQA